MDRYTSVDSLYSGNGVHCWTSSPFEKEAEKEPYGSWGRSHSSNVLVWLEHAGFPLCRIVAKQWPALLAVHSAPIKPPASLPCSRITLW